MNKTSKMHRVYHRDQDVLLTVQHRVFSRSLFLEAAPLTRTGCLKSSIGSVVGRLRKYKSDVDQRRTEDRTAANS